MEQYCQERLSLKIIKRIGGVGGTWFGADEMRVMVVVRSWGRRGLC